MEQQQENDINQQQVQQVSPAAALAIHTMTAAEKAKYFGVTGLMALIPAEVIGMGGWGLLTALAAGGLAAYWSEEVRDGIIDKLPAPKNAQTRSSKLEWLVTGRTTGVQQSGVQTDKLPEQTLPLSGGDAVFPHYPENETLRMGRVLATGQRFDPHFNEVVGKGFIATAVQGSGKSQLCGLIIEQSGKCGVPAMVLDHKGEYKAIKDLSFTNIFIAGSEGSDDRDFVLTKDNALELVELMMVNRYQVVVDLPSYGIDSWINKAEIVAAIGHALMTYAGKQRQLKQVILPCLVLLDEAQLYLPQDQTLLPPEATENKGILSDLKNAYFALVSNGRSNGYTMFFATQALTYIAKWAIKSCQIQSYGRQTEKNALDMCEKIIEPTVATREELYRLPPGVGVVYGFTQDPMIIQFDMKQSRDESETPKIERLRKPVQSVSTMPSVKLAVPQDQQITLSYADLMAIMNGNTPPKNREMISPSGSREMSGNTFTNDMEMSSQAKSSNIIDDVFPLSRDAEAEQPPRSEILNPPVSEEKLEMIRNMKEKNFKDSEIASIVRLEGRKYGIYQQCLVYLGYKKQEAK